jgi:two-component system response regulator YesN
MYSVFLIDDEPWALESLEHVLNLPRHGFAAPERYTNSLDAWRALEKRRPDVAFVDIRMPDMDGLTMARQAREADLHTLFVVVSGHREFSYAQRAIRSGVCDYCLKPLEREEAARLLENLRQRLDERLAAANAALCEEILSGVGADRLFANQGVWANAVHWLAVEFRFVDEGTLEAIRSLLKPIVHLMVWLGNTKLLAILNGEEELLHGLTSRLYAFQRSYPRLLIGVSCQSRHAESLASLISQAQSCAYNDFIDPNNRVVLYHTVENASLARWSAQACDAIAQRSQSRFQERLNELTPILLAEKIQMEALVGVWNELMCSFEYHAHAPEVLDEIKRVKEAEELRAFLNDLPSMTAYLHALMEQFVSAESPRAAVNESFICMLDYVRGHYCERLRLADLADKFHLNMAYASELFHKVTGMTYTDYLTKLRMERARAMIDSKNKTLTDVALSVGYGDYFTFSKRFKQYFGISPSTAAEHSG